MPKKSKTSPLVRQTTSDLDPELVRLNMDEVDTAPKVHIKVTKKEEEEGQAGGDQDNKKNKGPFTQIRDISCKRKEFSMSSLKKQEETNVSLRPGVNREPKVTLKARKWTIGHVDIYL